MGSKATPVDEVDPRGSRRTDLAGAAVLSRSTRLRRASSPGRPQRADGDVAVVVVGAEPDDLQPAVLGSGREGSSSGVRHDGAGLVDARGGGPRTLSAATARRLVAVAAPGQRHEAGLAVALEARAGRPRPATRSAPRSRCGRRRCGPGRGGGVAGPPGRPRPSRAAACSWPPATGTEARWAAQVPSPRENHTVRPSGLRAGSSAPPPGCAVREAGSTRPVSTETTTIRPSASATNRAGCRRRPPLWRFRRSPLAVAVLRSADPAGPPVDHDRRARG